MEQFLPGLVWYVAFLLSVVLHEAAHAFVAWRLGDSTAYLGGQVTLDPIPHIRREPMGMVVVPVLSFIAGGWMIGWGSTPYDPYWAMNHPRRSAWMSLAGPVANLLLVAACIGVIRIALLAGLVGVPESVRFDHVADLAGHDRLYGPVLFVSILFSLNLILLFFNLLPFPPLDGSALPLLFLEPGQARRYHDLIANPAFGWIGIVVAWNAFNYIFTPLHLAGVNLLYLGVARYG